MPRSQLLNMVKTDLRAKHYSESTEKTYINWIRRYIIFHNKQHPKDLGTEEIKKFINNLADEGKVSAAITYEPEGRRSSTVKTKENIDPNFEWNYLSKKSG